MTKVLLSALCALTLIGCNAAPSAEDKKVERMALEKTQDIRIIKSVDDNSKCRRTEIEKAFEDNGFLIDGNNDMNKPFSKRFVKVEGTTGGTWYKKYRLMTVHNPDIVAKLAKDYPSIGLITPLSMSVYTGKVGETEADSMSMSSLTLRGMSRITQIPMDNPALIEYANAMEKALTMAFPQGEFEAVKYAKVADMKQALETTFSMEVELEAGDEIRDVMDDFQDEFTGELEPVGFLFPGFIGVNDELLERGVDAYTVYDTYSICKLEVIHPVSRTHPEVGAFAPCSFYMYQKKGESTVHMGYPSVDNWITSTDLEDEYSLKPLVDAQNLLAKTIRDIVE
jgi:uncharacterized protein (DUF302 family)